MSKSKLTPDDLELAIKIRLFEEKLLELSRLKKINGTVHTCIGQEVIPVVLKNYLIKNDFIFSNHRCHGHYLARFEDFKGLALELLGSVDGVCRGIGGSQHINRENFYSSGIQGEMLAVASGVAYSIKEDNKKEIAICFVGDGTFGQGILYEVFNLISLWNLPILIIVEDNKYAQSTSIKQNTAGSFKKRAEAFDIKYSTCSANNLAKLNDEIEKSVTCVRNDRKPLVLNIDTYRLSPHSKGDDYRDQNEITEMKNNDFLTEEINKLDSSKLENLKEEIEEYFNFEVVLNEELTTSETLPKITSKEVKSTFGRIDVCSKLINESLDNLLATKKELLILGEDLEAPYGGAFKITNNLSEKYPGKVVNTPISEAAIIGFGIGRALTNKETIVEIMFSDFLALGFDQILNAGSKIRKMFGKDVYIPLVIRTANGSNRGYGATHSQDMSGHFIGIPNIDVFMPCHYTNFKDFYASLFSKAQNLAIVFENKKIYGAFQNQFDKKFNENYQISMIGSYPNVSYRISTQKEVDVTVVCNPALALEMEEVAKKILAEEINIDIFINVNLKIFDLENIKDSLKSSKKLLIIGNTNKMLGNFHWLWKELSESCEFVGEILSVENAIIPASVNLESKVFPSKSEIFNSILRVYEKN